MQLWKMVNLNSRLLKIESSYRLLLLLVLIAWAPAKEPSVITFERGITKLRVDNLQNCYAALDDNSIIKINKEGKQTASVNFKSFGKISHMDVTNPFMIYLFYRNQNALLVTDNFLNLRSTINLEQIESDFITVLARSIDDGIWIFDLNDYQLKKYNQSLDLQQTSGNVMSWLNDEPDFNFLVAEGKFVYLNSPSNGILVFDQFANYYKTIPLYSLEHFQVKKEQIYYQSDSLMLRYTPSFLRTDTLYTSIGKDRKGFVQAQRIVERDSHNVYLNP